MKLEVQYNMTSKCLVDRLVSKVIVDKFQLIPVTLLIWMWVARSSTLLIVSDILYKAKEGIWCLLSKWDIFMTTTRYLHVLKSQTQPTSNDNENIGLVDWGLIYMAFLLCLSFFNWSFGITFLDLSLLSAKMI